MEKYKSQHNNMNNDGIEQDNQNQKNEEAIRDVLTTGIDVAEKIPVASGYAKAAKMADKVTNGALTKGASKIVNQGFKNSPLGAQTQNVINQVSNSGITDMVSQTTNMGSSGNKLSTNNSKKNPLDGFLKNNNNTFLSNNIMSFSLGKSMKIKLIVGLGVILFFLLIIVTVVSGKDFENLDLTNQSTMTDKGGTAISKENIEKRIIYIGDTSVENIKSSNTNPNITYISDANADYNWLVNTANLELENILANKSDAIILFSIGLNDLANIDNYIAYYNELKTKYPSINIYFPSLVNDGSNQDILSFNEKINSNFTENYIDVSSIETNQMHNTVISNVRKNLGGNLLVQLEEVANWYIENVGTYNQGLFVSSPFSTSSVRADCTGFVVAYMSYVSGVDIPISYSGEMVHTDGSWARIVANYGWNAYKTDDVDSLISGDILVADSAISYSRGNHAEIYVSETETFGWGSAKEKYPTSSTLQKSIKSGHTIYSDWVGTKDQRDYVTIYRYGG